MRSLNCKNVNYRTLVQCTQEAPRLHFAKQIMLNLDLIKKFKELEKILTKRQLSQNREENGAPKQLKDSCKGEGQSRHQIKNKFDKFLMDDKEDDNVRHHHLNQRGRGHGGRGGQNRKAYNPRNQET
ncbi:hypothetical protein EDD85DRAFT_793793 [Armillaria nabsnona]|nr:hypothetical protein EDD85DRAFT_793793 [Armillaria nabsnona]